MLQVFFRINQCIANIWNNVCHSRPRCEEKYDLLGHLLSIFIFISHLLICIPSIWPNPLVEKTRDGGKSSLMRCCRSLRETKIKRYTVPHIITVKTMRFNTKNISRWTIPLQLPNMDNCSLMFTNAHQCSPMLTNAHQCSPMLTNVH